MHSVKGKEEGGRRRVWKNAIEFFLANIEDYSLENKDEREEGMRKIFCIIHAVGNASGWYISGWSRQMLCKMWFAHIKNKCQ